jgi:hypothetical protein
MLTSAEKARAQRLERLRSSIERGLEQPGAALDTLIAELPMGELHPDLWEGTHAAAARDGKEAVLNDAYEKLTAERRLKQFPANERASLLMHAADFSLGILGDAPGAERFLWRVLEAVPDHADAFDRLERKFQGARDKVKLGELYAAVAVKPSRTPSALARNAQEVVSLLTTETPLPDDACRKLFVLLPENHALLGVLETHLRKTRRFGLTCELLEAGVSGNPADVIDLRRRLVELYTGDAKTPEKAISHVEVLLKQDPSDSQARAAADRLLRVRDVASRAAAALQEARRNLR